MFCVFAFVFFSLRQISPRQLSLHIDQRAFYSLSTQKKSAFPFIQNIIFSYLEKRVIRMSH